MSDVIRGAESTVILSHTLDPAEGQEIDSLRSWGRRVWPLPEVLLSRGDTVTILLPLPQGSDRLMKRLICLLPQREEPWEQMSDQYNASLWDIYPSAQICGVGENDTTVVDGLQGAMIQ
ncbi:hypothetical protein Hte_007209 [Hypoxylon texense]